jgi:cysteinyl-tRNA synthetase
LRMLGVIEGNDALGFPVGEGAANVEATLGPVLDASLAFRDTIRQLAREKAPVAALLQACDAFRDEGMVNVGVRVEDTGAGKSLWKLDDAATLRRELAAKREKERQDALDKLKRKVETKRADLEKFAKGLVPADQMFRVETTLYVEARGLPNYGY